MSYEGYVEFLCPAGHHWSVDHTQEEEELADNLCEECEAPAVIKNDVDETNGSPQGYWDKEVLAPEVSRPCGECGRLKKISAITYKLKYGVDKKPLLCYDTEEIPE